MEVGANGLFTKTQIYVGNTTVNLAINSTSIVGNTVSIGSPNTATFYNYNGQSNPVNNFTSTAYSTFGGYGGNYLAFGQQTNFAQWIQSGFPSVASPVYYNIIFNPLGGNVGISNTSPSDKLSVNGTSYLQGNVRFTQGIIDSTGTQGTAGQVLTSNGSGNVYWSTVSGGGVNVAAQYTWTNTQTFSNTITFNGSILGSTINAASYTVGTAFIANSTQLTISNAVAVSANGTTGTSGQVLTSNGTTAYWSNASGNLPVIQSYTGDGTTNTFTVTGGYIANNISVYVNGSRLRNGTEANVQSGSTFTILSGNPPSGALIDVVGVSGLLASGAATLVSQTITANGTANSFAISGGYLSNTIMVWLNGVKQINGTDVIVTSGANVGFVVTPPNNYIIDVFGYQSLAVTTAGATSNAKLYAISMFIGG